MILAVPALQMAILVFCFDSEMFEFGLRLNKLFTGTFAAARMLILTLI